MARAATLEESIQFLNVLLVENPGDRAAALAALPDLGPQDSGTEDASNASNSPLPLPRYLPRIDLSNLGDLTPGLAIIEEWTKYIPAAEVFVKCIRVWPSEAAPLSRSPTMIVAVNYLRNNRLDWSRWPLDRACFRLTRLKIGARTVMRASKLQTNFTRVSAFSSAFLLYIFMSLLQSTLLADWAEDAMEYVESFYAVLNSNSSPCPLPYLSWPRTAVLHRAVTLSTPSKAGLAIKAAAHSTMQTMTVKTTTTMLQVPPMQNLRIFERRSGEKLAHSKQLSETSSMADEYSDPPPPGDAMVVDDPQPQEAPSPVPSPPPAVSSTGRPVRTKRPTWKLLQLLPEPPSAAPDRSAMGRDPEPTPPSAPSSFVWDSVKSAMNSFGLYREYPRAPTHDPDSTISLVDLSDIPRPPAPAATTATAPPVPLPPAETQNNPYHPFPNSTAYGITNWMWSGSPLKSIEEVTKLVDFLKSDAFRKEDLATFNLSQATEMLDKLSSSAGKSPVAHDGWSETDVEIKVPIGRKDMKTGSPPPMYTVPGLFLRPLSEVLKSAIHDTMMSRHFHFTPFKQFHKSHPDAVPSRVLDEIYSSDAMIAEYEKLQSQPAEPGCELERVILCLMFWSDSTHLATFGNASLWPLYLFFGNLSKWVRAKPRSGACHHLAYIPKLPDEFHDFYTRLTGSAPSADVLAHCRRELMHAVWEKILDDDFMEAYEHGIVLKCHDDYPEKTLLAGIRNLGSSPCPRCKITTDKIPNVGTKNDDKARTKLERVDTPAYRGLIATARRWIYDLGDNVKSARVERLFKANLSRPDFEYILPALFQATTHLGRQLRYFVANTCPHFDTRELPKEEAARGRRKARKSKKQSRVVPQRRKGAAANPEKVKVTMNLKTYKFHSLGDYLHFIPWFGTSDSYSTQTGELEHRRVKRFYARTNKNTAVRQMTILERREQALLHIARKLGKILPSPPPQPHTKGKRKAGAKRKVKKSSLHVDFLESETLPYTAPEQHHHISASRNFHTNIPQFLHENEGDPAVQDFLPKLKNHLLGRLAHPDYSDDTEEFTDEERHSLVIANNRMYRHKVLRVNYTTYDVRRGQDSMNPRTRADIMTLAPQGDTSHPFSYARLLSVFHVDVIRNVRGATHVPVPTSLDVLWVRNFRRDTSFRAGFKAKRLHRLEFIPADQPNAFSFLNPDEVIRGAHLIPAFHHGRTHDLLGEGPSLALDDEDMGEWRYHYVNMFVDRDMYMRYVGGGIGHYKVEVDNEVGTAGDGEDIGLGPEGDSESEDVGEVNSGAAEGEDGASVVPGDGDEVDDSEKRVGSESGSDSEDSQGSGASTTDDDGDDDGGEGSDTESSVDLGAEDGEGYMEEEEEEGYAPL
ncbi:hypothetical protein MSAN_00980100 [Mycena sanguinolenta]|uniref:Uncharacterized protein n=1 Tax=Mycena sanguinolenta TaxID=230812 RepID=A0A8H7DCL4_9AGAR|nr:hypothetical protein MSAN_00980100 [Mycena sanguinolenta]